MTDTANESAATTSSAKSEEQQDPNTFVLYVWPGDWEMPSIDAESACSIVIECLISH